MNERLAAKAMEALRELGWRVREAQENDPDGLHGYVSLSLEQDGWEVEYTVLDPARNVTITRPTPAAAIFAVIEHDDEVLERSKAAV